MSYIIRNIKFTSSLEDGLSQAVLINLWAKNKKMLATDSGGGKYLPLGSIFIVFFQFIENIQLFIVNMKNLKSVTKSPLFNQNLVL